jgi:hypothetical protein
LRATTLPCAQPPQADALRGLAFYADLRSDEEIDLDAASEQHFINPAGNRFPIAPPAMKAAAMALSAVYPNALTYLDLLTATRQMLAEYDSPESVDEAAFRDALFPLVMVHCVMPTVSVASYANEPGERPSAHTLARQQARSPSWVVSGARHVAMDLDAPGRMLLGMLDGRHRMDELAAAMQRALAEQGLTMPLETVGELTQQQLWLFARQGLLAA